MVKKYFGERMFLPLAEEGRQKGRPPCRRACERAVLIQIYCTCNP